MSRTPRKKYQPTPRVQEIMAMLKSKTPTDWIGNKPSKATSRAQLRLPCRE